MTIVRVGQKLISRKMVTLMRNDIKNEKEKLCKVKKWRDELLRELRNDKDMPMDEYCLRARLAEVIDGYIAIQSRLVITLEKKKEEADG